MPIKPHDIHIFDFFQLFCAVLPVQVREAEVGSPRGAGHLAGVPLTEQFLAGGHRLPVLSPEHWPPAPPSVR